jgi:hypothetical protein
VPKVGDRQGVVWISVLGQIGEIWRIRKNLTYPQSCVYRILGAIKQD